MVSSISDVEKDEVTLSTPSASNTPKGEWKEEHRKFRQTGKLIEGCLHCYFGEELQDLMGDADDMGIKEFRYNAQREEIEIVFAKYWY